MDKTKLTRRRRRRDTVGEDIKTSIKIPKDLHRRIEQKAIDEDISLNAMVNRMLRTHPILQAQA